MEKQKHIFGMTRRILSVMFLLGAVVLSVITTVHVSRLLLDSDASANLILGEKIAREGGILSATWVYSTELCVLDTQLVYAFLFKLTSDWFAVRVAGALIMQAFLLGSYGYLARQTKMSFNAFCVTGAVLLLPISVAYGRIVLYHNYYMPHITLDFLMIGLFLSAGRKDHWLKGTMWTILRCALLCGIAFCTGMSSIRQLMICGVPLLAAVVLNALLAENGQGEGRLSRLKMQIPSITLAGAAVVSMLAGYLLNTNVLTKIYQVQTYENEILKMEDTEGIMNIIRGFLSAIGFQDYSALFSAKGIVSVALLIAMILILILTFHTIRHTMDESARFMQIYMLMCLFTMTSVFLFLADGNWLYELYYVPVLVWILPALGKSEIRPPEETGKNTDKKEWLRLILGTDTRPMNMHRLVSVAVCMLLAVSGIYYSIFFNKPSEYGTEITYSGLNYTDIGTAESLRPVAEYMKEQGFTLCYATYWNAGVITELSDGQVRSVSVEAGTRRRPIRYYTWLTDLNLRDSEWLAKQKVCLLADIELESQLEEMKDVRDTVVELKDFDGDIVYEIKDPLAFADIMS